MTYEQHVELLAVIRLLKADAVRRGEPDADYWPRVQFIERALDAAINPPASTPPSRLGLFDAGGGAWHFREGERTAQRMPGTTLVAIGLRIAYEAFQRANDPTLPPQPPDAYFDNRAPRQSTDRAIGAAAEWLKDEHDLRWLALEVRQIRIRTMDQGQELIVRDGNRTVDTEKRLVVAYTGDRRIDTTTV